MITSRDKIKEWFKTGAKPTQEQFYDWIDSYWHKYDDVSGILNQMQGATYMGEAHPDDVPPVTKQKVFYTATSAGTYTNFAGAVLASGEKAILLYDKAWSKITLSVLAQELGDSKEVAVSQKVVQSEIKHINNTIKEQIVQDFGQNTAKTISQKVVTERFGEVETLAKTKMSKQQGAEQGNVVMFGEGGEVADSNIEVSNVAKQNGYYESMIVGASRNLAGNNIVTAKYTYRPTADTTDVADGVAKISSVKGNTIVWNQLIQNGNFADNPNNDSLPNHWINGDWNITSIATISYPSKGGIKIVCDKKTSSNNVGLKLSSFIGITANRKYKLSFKYSLLFPEEVTTSDAHIYIGGTLNNNQRKKIPSTNGDEIQYNKIVTFSENTNIFQIQFAKGVKLGEELWIDNIQFLDLTQMFGEGNEPTLEEFEAMFPNDYYEYNEGELKSIEDFQIKSVGFNQWDEEWENGSIDTQTGDNISTSKAWRSKSYIHVIGNTNYSFTMSESLRESGIGLYEYDERKTLLYARTLNYENLGTSKYPFVVTLKQGTNYIRIADRLNTTYKNDICINLSHSGIRDGEYEPYQEDILPINISTIKDENGEVLFPNGLCSAGEAHDELVYDKTIGKWKAVKRIGSVDMGTLTWFYDDGSSNSNVYPYGFFGTGISGRRYGRTNILSIKYPYGGFTKDKSIAGNSDDASIYIKDSAYTDLNSFKASLQGQILYYELAEPIEVVLDDFTSNYKVSDWGTEEILMNTTPIVPVIYDVEYALNAVDTLRNMPTNYISKESLDAFLSTLGSAMGGTWTATYNETNGRYDFTFSANASATELINE